MDLRIVEPKFFPHSMYVTEEASKKLDPLEIILGILQHFHGEWGGVDPETREDNERTLAGLAMQPLMSFFVSLSGAEFVVITCPDRSATTVRMFRGEFDRR